MMIVVIHVMKIGTHWRKDKETWDERGWTGDHNESSRFWGILNVLIRGISRDESGIIHHRPHHAGERVHQKCLISTSLDDD